MAGDMAGMAKATGDMAGTAKAGGGMAGTVKAGVIVVIRAENA